MAFHEFHFNYTYPTWIEATSWVNGLELIREGHFAVSFQRANKKGNPNKVFFQQLRQCFQDCSTIRAINLTWSYVGDEGAEEIALGLRESKSLLTLLLNDCCIGDRGAKALANGLIHNKSLLYLGLLKNYIKEKGMSEFARALSDEQKGNNTLKKLSLSASNVTEMEHMSSIRESLIRNKIIQEKAYVDAFKNSGAGRPWRRTRMMLVGQGRAGKSALVNSFLNLPFEETWDSTIGVKLTQTEVTMKRKKTMWNAIPSKVKMYHTTGLAARLAVTRMANDSTNPESPDSRSVGAWENEKRSNTFVEHKDIKEVAGQFDENLMSKARENNGDKTMTCSIWDYGGQNVFYTLHHLFLTRYGVYLVVFNMEELLTDAPSAEQYLRFWLNSVKMHAEGAPIFIVGTFADTLSSDERKLDVEAFLQRMIGDKFKHVARNEKDSLVFFPVSNKTGEGILELRQAVIESAEQQVHANITVKMRWMLCLDNFDMMNEPWLTLTKVQEIARAAGISNSTEVEEMLRLYHQLGMVVHLTSTQTLANVVVTNPQWLLDSISLLIRDPEIHSFERMEELESVGLKQDIDLLFSKGLVTYDLVQFLWGSEQVDFLLAVMKHTMLLSEWEFDEEHDDKMYLVPSLLQESHTEEPLPGALECRLDFSEDYLPIGSFQRLICLCVTHSSHLRNSAIPVLARNYAKLSFGQKTELELKEAGNVITMRVGNHLMASTCLMIISSMLTKLKEDVLGRLSWKVTLQNGNQFIPYDEAKEQNIEPWFINIRELSKSKNYNDIDVDEFVKLMRDTYNAEEEEELEFALENVANDR